MQNEEACSETGSHNGCAKLCVFEVKMMNTYRAIEQGSTRPREDKQR